MLVVPVKESSAFPAHGSVREADRGTQTGVGPRRLRRLAAEPVRERSGRLDGKAASRPGLSPRRRRVGLEQHYPLSTVRAQRSEPRRELAATLLWTGAGALLALSTLFGFSYGLLGSSARAVGRPVACQALQDRSRSPWLRARLVGPPGLGRGHALRLLAVPAVSGRRGRRQLVMRRNESAAVRLRRRRDDRRLFRGLALYPRLAALVKSGFCFRLNATSAFVSKRQYGQRWTRLISVDAPTSSSNLQRR